MIVEWESGVLSSIRTRWLFAIHLWPKQEFDLLLSSITESHQTAELVSSHTECCFIQTIRLLWKFTLWPHQRFKFGAKHLLCFMMSLARHCLAPLLSVNANKHHKSHTTCEMALRKSHHLCSLFIAVIDLLPHTGDPGSISRAPAIQNSLAI